MPRLSKEKREILKLAIIAQDKNDSELAREYGVTPKAVTDYRKKLLTPNSKAVAIINGEKNDKVLQTKNDTIQKRWAIIATLENQLQVVSKQLRELSPTISDDGKPFVPSGVFLASLNAVSKTINDCLNGIDRAGSIADTVTLNDNRSVTILNQDTLGKKLWQYLEAKGLLKEALDYLSKEE